MLPAPNVRAAITVREDPVALTHVIDEGTLVLAPIWVGGDTRARSLILDPVALVPDLCVRPSVFSIAMLLVHYPFTFIRIGAIFGNDGHFALSISFIISPHARVDALVSVGHCTEPILLSFSPGAFVLIFRCGPSVFPRPTDLIIDEGSDVGAAIRPCEFACALSKVITPLAIVLGLVSVAQLAVTVPLVILILAFVLCAAWPRVNTITMALVADPLTLVVAAILELVRLDLRLRKQSSQVDLFLRLRLLLRHVCLSLRFCH